MKIYNYTGIEVKAMDEEGVSIQVIDVLSDSIIHLDGICIVDSMDKKVGLKMVLVDTAINHDGIIIYKPDFLDCSVEDLLEILC